MIQRLMVRATGRDSVGKSYNHFEMRAGVGMEWGESFDWWVK